MPAIPLSAGCGCRHGFCGACATIYRIKGKNELKTCLACQTQVEEGMYIATIPFYPTDKRTYDINDIKPTEPDYDGALPGNLFLHRLQRLHEGLPPGD